MYLRGKNLDEFKSAVREQRKLLEHMHDVGDQIDVNNLREAVLQLVIGNAGMLGELDRIRRNGK